MFMEYRIVSRWLNVVLLTLASPPSLSLSVSAHLRRPLVRPRQLTATPRRAVCVSLPVRISPSPPFAGQTSAADGRPAPRCVADAEAAGNEQHVTVARYLTYGGLCLATCILLQRSVSLAAIVGLLVAGYITLSEYQLDGRSGAL